MSAPEGAPIPTLSSERERCFLLTLAAVQFSHIVDFMVTMPLDPFLMQGLGIDTRQFGLLVASYSFCASGVPAAGFVDRFERKRLMLVLFALFVLATLACGLATSYATLLVARGLAGAFGGILGSMVQSLAMGAASSLAGFVIAQDTDGRFTGYHLVGYIGVAAGLLSMALAGRVRMRNARQGNAERIRSPQSRAAPVAVTPFCVSPPAGDRAQRIRTGSAWLDSRGAAMQRWCLPELLSAPDRHGMGARRTSGRPPGCGAERPVARAGLVPGVR